MAGPFDNAAASIIAHHATLKRERDYIASVYRQYESKQLDAMLAEAGIHESVQALAKQDT